MDLIAKRKTFEQLGEVSLAGHIVIEAAKVAGTRIDEIT